MEAKEKAIEMLQIKQRIKEVQAKMNYCVHLNTHDGQESFDYWNSVMKELLLIAEYANTNLSSLNEKIEEIQAKYEKAFKRNLEMADEIMDLAKSFEVSQRNVTLYMEAEKDLKKQLEEKDMEIELLVATNVHLTNRIDKHYKPLFEAQEKENDELKSKLSSPSTKELPTDELKLDFQKKLTTWLVNDREKDFDDLFNSVLPHLQASTEERSCPCLYLETPCQEGCSCRNEFSSKGCLYCCTYGSKEQQTQKAEHLKSLMEASTVGSEAKVKGLTSVCEGCFKEFPMEFSVSDEDGNETCPNCYREMVEELASNQTDFAKWAIVSGWKYSELINNWHKANEHQKTSEELYQEFLKSKDKQQ